LAANQQRVEIEKKSFWKLSRVLFSFDVGPCKQTRVSRMATLAAVQRRLLAVVRGKWYSDKRPAWFIINRT